MIWSHEVAQVTAQTQQELAQNAEYAQYTSQLYGAGANGMLAGGGMWGGAQPGQQFAYGNPTGAQATAGMQVGQTAMGAMHGLGGAAATLGGVGVMAATFVPGLAWADPQWAVMMRANAAGASVFRGAGMSAPGFFRGASGVMSGQGAAGAMGMGARAGLVGRAAVGAVAGALPLAAAVYAGYKAAHFGVQNFYAGAEEQLAVNQTLLTSGTRANLPGMGMHRWSTGEMTQMGRTVSDVAFNNIWTSNQEVNGILGQGLQSGMFKNVQSPQELRGALRELVDALKDTSRTFNTTLSGAMPILQQYRGLGFNNYGQAAGVAQAGMGLGVAGGLSAGTMYGFASMGAQQAQASGLRAGMIRQGTMSSMNFAGRIGYAAQTGVISDDQLLEMTGQMGEAGRASYAQQIGDSSRRMMSGRWGRLITMSMMDPNTGEAGPGLGGRLSSIENMIGGARSSMGTRAGKVNWLLNRRRIGEETIQQQGPEGVLGATFNMLAEKVNARTGGDSDTTDLVLQRLTGEDSRFVQQMRTLQQLLPELKQETRQAAANASRQAMGESYYRENVSVQAAWKKFKRATVDRVSKPIREFGAGVMQNVSQGISEALEDIAGVQRFDVSPTVANAFESAQHGSYGAWNAMKDIGGSGVPSYLAGASPEASRLYSNSAGAMVAPGSGFGSSTRTAEYWKSQANQASAGMFGLGAGFRGAAWAGGKLATTMEGLNTAIDIESVAGWGAKARGLVGRAVGLPLEGLGRGLGWAGKGISGGVEGWGFAAGAVPRLAGGALSVTGGAIRAGGMAAGGIARAAAGPWGMLATSEVIGTYQAFKMYGNLEQNTSDPLVSALLGTPTGRSDEPGMLARPMGSSVAGMSLAHGFVPFYDASEHVNRYGANQLLEGWEEHKKLMGSSELSALTNGVGRDVGRQLSSHVSAALRYSSSVYGDDDSDVAMADARTRIRGIYSTTQRLTQAQRDSGIRLANRAGSMSELTQQGLAIADSFGAPGGFLDVTKSRTRVMHESEKRDLWAADLEGRYGKDITSGEYEKASGGYRVTGGRMAGKLIPSDSLTEGEMVRARGVSMARGSLMTYLAPLGPFGIAAGYGLGRLFGGSDAASATYDNLRNATDYDKDSRKWLSENNKAATEALLAYNAAADDPAKRMILEKFARTAESPDSEGGASAGTVLSLMTEIAQNPSDNIKAVMGNVAGTSMDVQLQHSREISEERRASWAGAVGGRSPTTWSDDQRGMRSAMAAYGGPSAEDVEIFNSVTESGNPEIIHKQMTQFLGRASGMGYGEAEGYANMLDQRGQSELASAVRGSSHTRRLLYDSNGKARTKSSDAKQILGVMSTRLGLSLTSLEDDYKESDAYRLFLAKAKTGGPSSRHALAADRAEFLKKQLNLQISGSDLPSEEKQAARERADYYVGKYAGVASSVSEGRAEEIRKNDVAEGGFRGGKIGAVRGPVTRTKDGSLDSVKGDVDKAVGTLTEGLRAAGAALKQFAADPTAFTKSKPATTDGKTQ